MRIMKMSFLQAPGLAVSLVLAGLVSGGAVAGEPAGISISNAWVRMIVPSRPAAGYFTLTNDSDTKATLTGASSPGCGSTMLHQSVKENGTDKMVMVMSVDVPAHGTLSFAPAGYHVMCMAPTDAMKIGAKVPFTLTFGDGSSLTSDFEVKGPADK